MTDRRLRGLYAITRSGYGSTAELVTEVGAALRGGCRIVQYRDKHGTPAQRLEQVKALRGLCDQHGALLIVNDDIELASAIGADGVHLGRDDTDLSAARERLGTDTLIGISCYNQLEAARHAATSGASYIAFGAFFPSPTKPAAVRAPLTLLEQWDHPNVPACAIGGITLDNAATLIRAGAAMTAVISDLWTAADIEERARAYGRLWDGY